MAATAEQNAAAEEPATTAVAAVSGVAVAAARVVAAAVARATAVAQAEEPAAAAVAAAAVAAAAARASRGFAAVAAAALAECHVVRRARHRHHQNETVHANSRVNGTETPWYTISGHRGDPLRPIDADGATVPCRYRIHSMENTGRVFGVKKIVKMEKIKVKGNMA
jgi:hypothetical protein